MNNIEIIVIDSDDDINYENNRIKTNHDKTNNEDNNSPKRQKTNVSKNHKIITLLGESHNLMEIDDDNHEIHENVNNVSNSNSQNINRSESISQQAKFPRRKVHKVTPNSNNSNEKEFSKSEDKIISDYCLSQQSKHDWAKLAAILDKSGYKRDAVGKIIIFNMLHYYHYYYYYYQISCKGALDE